MQSGAECNTRLLRERCGWRGVMLDGGHQQEDAGLYQHFITASNIASLLTQHGANSRPDLDLLAVDIDGNDYAVTRALLIAGWRPRVLMVEYAYGLPLGAPDMVMPYRANHRNDGTCYGSASATSFQMLLREFRYSLVSVMLPDLYFVRDDVLATRADGPYMHTNDLRRLEHDGMRFGIPTAQVATGWTELNLLGPAQLPSRPTAQLRRRLPHESRGPITSLVHCAGDKAYATPVAQSVDGALGRGAGGLPNHVAHARIRHAPGLPSFWLVGRTGKRQRRRRASARAPRHWSSRTRRATAELLRKGGLGGRSLG